MLWPHNDHVTKEFPTYSPKVVYYKKIYNMVQLHRGDGSGEYKDFSS